MTIKLDPRVAAGATGILLLLTCFTVRAEPSKFEEQIRYRRAVMVMIKWHMEKISPLVKNPQVFNRDEVLNNAAIAETLSKLTLEGFVSGSYEGETKAKAAIWKDWNRFKAQSEKFAVEAAKLHERARSGDAAAIKAQLRETNKACKSCHDEFKSSSLF